MDPQIRRLLKDPVLRHAEALTIGYLSAFRGYDKPAEMAATNSEDFERGWALGEQARKEQATKEGPAPTFLGYYPDVEIPLTKGQVITLPAGSRVTYKGVTKVSTKARKVRVDHIISGSNYHIRKNHDREEVQPITAPKVRWAGSGGYWAEVDINQVPEAVRAAEFDRSHAEHRARFIELEAKVERVAAVLEQIRKDFDSRPGLWPFKNDGFNLRIQSEKANYFQVDAVADDAVIAGFTVDTCVDAGKIVLRINVTSNCCQSLSGARLILKAFNLLMAQAEHIDATYCQPWNLSQ